MSGETLVGGLTGFVNGSVTASYWDTTTSGVATSAGGTGATTAALQSATGTNGIYGTWSADHWHFGTAAQYPVLAVDADDDDEATWQEFGYQLRDGPTLTATAVGNRAVELSWTAVDVSHWTPAPEVAYTVTRDDGATVAAIGEALTGLTHRDTGLTDGAAYTYQVSAVVAEGEATRSAPRAVTAVDNRAPLTVGTLASRTLPVADGSVDVDVSGSFSDLDNDVLTYRAISSMPTVASVSVSGSRVTVTPLAGGTTTITVTATDAGGSNMSAVQTFVVTVPNRPPVAAGRLANRSLEVSGGVLTVDVSGAFRDPDGDDLTYRASSSAASVASVTPSGSPVSVTPLSRGTATITVTATDAGGSNMSATQMFTVTVANQAPVVVGMLPRLTLRAGGVQSVDVAGVFEDPDDDPLTFDASSSDALVATASARGSTVRLSAVWPGTVEVTVTAEDTGGLRAEQSFELTVPNRPPVPVGTLPGLSLASGGPAESVDVSGAFADSEDDPLTFEASSSAEAVAAVVVSGSVVVVTPLTAGAAIVTVTATDVGASNTAATQAFGVGVDEPPPRIGGGGGGGGRGPSQPSRPPEVVSTLADPVLTLGASSVGVDVATAFEDPDDDALTYAAESVEGVAVVALEGSVVTVTPVGAGTAVVTVTASDGEEENPPATQMFTVTVVVDYDADADGLIEVRTLAQLDAVRHDLNGDGVPAEAGAEAHATAFEGAIGGLSCGDAECRGYELLADLNFDTNGSGDPDAGDTYWNDGSGWSPIGTEAAPFAAAFEGNGRVIRSLFVAGGEGAGLFGATGASSVVARVGLIAVDVTGTRAVGALAGRNDGRVTAGWATGRVSGSEAAGGLVGSNTGGIGGSYAAVEVSGGRQAGGFVGVNEGSLVAVHATGQVFGAEAVGGLVGQHLGTLTASYSTGRVRGPDEAGGLVGAVSEPGTVTASYWDTETSGRASSSAGRGLSTAALQRPTAYGGLYALWNMDVDGDGMPDGPWHTPATAGARPMMGASPGRPAGAAGQNVAPVRTLLSSLVLPCVTSGVAAWFVFAGGLRPSGRVRHFQVASPARLRRQLPPPSRRILLQVACEVAQSRQRLAVFAASRRPFALDYVFDRADPVSVDLLRSLASILVVLDSIRGVHDVYVERTRSDLDEIFSSFDLLDLLGVERETELAERAHQPPPVRRRAFDEEVGILRRVGEPLHDGRHLPDQQVLDVVAGERIAQPFQITVVDRFHSPATPADSRCTSGGSRPCSRMPGTARRPSPVCTFGKKIPIRRLSGRRRAASKSARFSGSIPIARARRPISSALFTCSCSSRPCATLVRPAAVPRSRSRRLACAKFRRCSFRPC